ncbi:SHOCT domain-containing protein [Thermodesulfobacteriota bacterium]
MMHWGGDFGMGFGGGWIFMIIFWGLVIFGIVYLVKAPLGGGSTEGKRSESAQEVLEKRFARGEMSKEEFEDALEVLQRNRS